MRRRLWLVISMLALCVTLGFAQDKELRTKRSRSGLASAPESAHGRVNPYEGKAEAALAGRKLFERHCAECHGTDARGRGKAPSLDSGLAQLAPPGDLFWFLTNGNLRAGMPSWSRLPGAQRWQIVVYLKTLGERHTP
ncbi:MAG TPA: c-type cytochrome [Candidatus Acidoferrales bacterium]|nr:c-type cytochrome [Candidatus Acidoferrales bacterium]